MKTARSASCRWVLAGMAGLTLLASAGRPQEARTVTGAATYRERMALPTGAVFEATLEDVSRAGAQADVIAKARLKNPGQPPFRFSIHYDPARIVESHSYAVRARISQHGSLMFTTDQTFEVLTHGNGSHVEMMIMRRVAAPSAGGDAAVLEPLPASFAGELPCADCPAIRYDLNLFADKSFFLRMTYVGKNEAKPLNEVGRWALANGGSRLTLSSGKESPDSFAVKSRDILRKLDLQGREIESKFNYDLRRTAAFQRIEPRLVINGLFRYMADAAVITECLTGQRWPVAMEAGYISLEEAYIKTRRQPGEELMVSVEGTVAMRPTPDDGQPAPTLVVHRYIGIWPGETCGAALATSSLEETYWKLTRLGDKPVILGANQREPSLVFRSAQSRVTGFGGCNNLTGAYKLNGGDMVLSGVAATQMACVQGMDVEDAFFKALQEVRRWKIFGEHLELYDGKGKMVARLEARAMK